MIITVQRILSNTDETVGIIKINGFPVGVSCEDQKQNKKVAGETRIAEGTYKIALRTVGTHHEHYSKTFPKIHKGMLELQNVPEFKYILIHIGNTEKDTDGCILVGEKIVISPTGRFSIENSSLAYQRIYKRIIDEISAGKEVSIKIEDIEKK